MFLSIIQVFAIQILLPVYFLFTLGKKTFNNKLDWLIESLLTAIFLVWLFLIGSWDWIGYYIRYFYLLLFVFSFYLSFRKIKALPFRSKLDDPQKFSRGVNILLLVVFTGLSVFAISGFFAKEETIKMFFPLKEGTYYIGHGGSTTQLNYHNAYDDQAYALDIVKINNFGIRAKGIYPKELDKYFIFDDALYSPCSGAVVGMETNQQDEIPPEMNKEQVKGNYVAIQCEKDDVIVYLAHMQKGSVTVKEGDWVKEGDHIGNVGNSGNTTEPHLHIHAEKDGKGVPIEFDGQFLVRNQLVKTK